MYYAQQQHSTQYHRRQQQPLQYYLPVISSYSAPASGVISPPPRVLSLICQIIYIFLCLSLGLLYLYLYRILKRILLSKSQNYVHGFQSLSYAIYITVAAAVLFVILAFVQIFGAICIPTIHRFPIHGAIEFDWLHWGYQFSLRLIEIAIITLISWVGSLKINAGGGGASNVNSSEHRLGSTADEAVRRNSLREKATGGSNLHSNVANLFLPCTTSSSQEHIETDYPVICSANTNLHTYTMRTGKLIYEESFALNSMAGSGLAANHPPHSNSRVCSEYQLHHPTYQNPYETSSMRNSTKRNSNRGEYEAAGSGHVGTLHNNHHRYNFGLHDQNRQSYTDYITDADASATDHYENPNFDLNSSDSAKTSGNTASSRILTKFGNKTEAVCTPATTSSNCSSASQLKLQLLGIDGNYSEHSTHVVNSYENDRFEKTPHDGGGGFGYITDDDNSATFWPDNNSYNVKMKPIRNEDSDGECTKVQHIFKSANSGPHNRYGGGYNSCGPTFNEPCDSRKCVGGGGGGTLNGAAYSTKKMFFRTNNDHLEHLENENSIKDRGVAAGGGMERGSSNLIVGQTNRMSSVAAVFGRNRSNNYMNNTIHRQEQLQLQVERKSRNRDEIPDDDELISTSNLVESTNLIENEDDNDTTIAAFAAIHQSRQNSVSPVSKNVNAIISTTSYHHQSGKVRAQMTQRNQQQQPSARNFTKKSSPSVISSDSSANSVSAADALLMSEGIVRYRDSGCNNSIPLSVPAEIHNVSMHHSNKLRTANISSAMIGNNDSSLLTNVENKAKAAVEVGNSVHC